MSVTYPSGAALAGWSYDAQGRIQSQSRFETIVTGYGYDGASRLAGLTHDLAGSAADLALGFEHNSASQIVSRTVSNDSYAFAPAAGSSAYSANGLNQHTSVAGADHSHDLNDNLVSDGATTFTYDVENRLVAASSPRRRISGSPTIRRAGSGG